MDAKNFIAKRVAKYFEPGDVVNLGIGIPTLSAQYAAETVLFHGENGIIGVGDLAKGLLFVESFCNASGEEIVPAVGASICSSATSFGIVRGGRLAATVLGALEVSEFGDLANWATPKRAFGMGGAMDLVVGAKKVIVAMEHCTKDGLPKIRKECTFPYTGLRCVNHIVTELCVFDVGEKGLLLRELAPGKTIEDVAAKTDAPFEVADDLGIIGA
ncbi:MAG: acetate CoA/acetoacetate CoA-transferase beta subunit [Clostridiales bacterium]|jgi:3-oxoacid CoA-transferase subunit B/acetate CoA/acetoacetate CoA-transferase beta subunit|nr:acetate CoA/acetoacetate CoA-transferase beta subunit [Clostridiales bacterium]MDN5300447.1 acetate CoA/acetoacetate CoA-transferase beta subunit [Clostridiales bacterium]